ncbi:MAG: glutamine-hydrolyzing carbamoyl-phosphate synthase small subunit [Alphaproteobacteria bacterium]|jgi:carbamoyl-phosphate synthase small subunit|nr:glutamine-hydrolyzing carbamoyl-phosphate synthase small subunit [Alphaproteobacteria bacterium]MDP6238031.1 glutamine-hydrolyzing carbamoyl-phosphate synthase small subunit [Alphaproteobacteria bacterium]MDP7173728.1 glutamine-hydrolyzing carbamoyl-phosphate synthase small subunit [Alphaproteobacteria bacterium]MDP7234671.1 glutamine-hydrolyzing carbamoyl-phosphate synthase small subunit [Alphaproteobacteria bacterium]MDP7488282.1 glutamine-hydrolyzing carbamoyl-phosphate synthase small sub|tara:strand:- start:155 stop:1321 length:1167 start_codon:yes stop_codon:yes gene_type:complete
MPETNTTAHRVGPPTAVLVLGDGRVVSGQGLGASASAVGEVCFNTSMTGYQEIISDPSYAGQLITFTFPHIGNVGSNEEDLETITPAARGCILRCDITEPSNWRASRHLDAWLVNHGLPGIAGVDTRALTQIVRKSGAPNGIIAHNPDGRFDLETLRQHAATWPGLEGMDLAREVSCSQSYTWDQTAWSLEGSFGRFKGCGPHVVAIDFGAKHNILRCLASAGCRVTVVPAATSAEDVLAHKPDGIFLSNGPGDPAATGSYAVPVIRALLETAIPIFGICLGHQMLALALGARTRKMRQGHRGANHPVKDLATGKVEITSQNHGFMVDAESLPEGVEQTHISLFDGTLEGLRLTDKPVFSVQHHPEASPGPRDSHYLFDHFVATITGS